MRCETKNPNWYVINNSSKKERNFIKITKKERKLVKWVITIYIRNEKNGLLGIRRASNVGF